MGAGSVTTTHTLPAAPVIPDELPWPAWRRLAGTALLVSLVYYLGAQIGFVFKFPEVPTSIFWLPNSTMLAVFMLAPRRRWWVEPQQRKSSRTLPERCRLR